MATDERTIRGKVAIAGLAETTYYKRGQATDPEFKMALQAIIAAAGDAGIDVTEIDGFASYSNDRNDPVRLATALGLALEATADGIRPDLHICRHIQKYE